MKLFFIIMICVLPASLCGQYTYFNEGYLPPFTNIGSGQSVELIVRNDSLFAYGFAPFENTNGRVVLAVNLFGELQSTLLFEEGNVIHQIDYPDVVIRNQNGFVWAGGNGSYPIVIQMNDLFEEIHRTEFPELFTDTTSATFFTSCTGVENTVISIGRYVYDLIPQQPGQDFANLILTKISADGNVIWFREYSFEDLEVTGDYQGPFIFPRGGIYELENGQIIAFVTIGNQSDCFAFKFDGNGNYIDQVKWGNLSVSDGSPLSVRLNDDQFRFVYGTHSYTIGDYSFSHPLSGILNSNDMSIELDAPLQHDYLFGTVTDIERTPDNGYAILYYGEPDANGEEFGFAYVIKLNESGIEEWHKQFAPPEPYDTQTAFDLEVTQDGGLAFVGNYHPYNQGVFYYKSWIIKTDACGDLIYNGCPLNIDSPQTNNLEFTIMPNPTHDILKISYPGKIKSVELFDQTGKRMVQPEIFHNSSDHILHLADIYANGFYFIEIESEDGNFAYEKFIFQHD